MDKLQFKPGDTCTVLLAGQLVITGFIEDATGRLRRQTITA